VELAQTLAGAAAALLAVDPAGLGGAILPGGSGAGAVQWTEALRALLPPGAPVRRLPLAVTADRLIGGLDLAATLRAGRAVAERGVLAGADGGVVVAPMAERLSRGTLSALVSALDAGVVAVQRDGIAAEFPARFVLVALDESVDGEERVAAALVDRVAFVVAEPPLIPRELLPTAADVARARAMLGGVRLHDGAVESFCAAAVALGVDTLRAPIFACRAARAGAALDGRMETNDDDAALAARLVLAPRATTMPGEAAAEPDGTDDAPPDDGSGVQEDRGDRGAPPDADAGEVERAQQTRRAEDVVLAAAVAAIPRRLLEQLAAGAAGRGGEAGVGGGRERDSAARGRQVGARRGDPGRGRRLHVIETLRAAAPWQRMRRVEDVGRVENAGPPPRVQYSAEPAEQPNQAAAERSVFAPAGAPGRRRRTALSAAPLAAAGTPAPAAPLAAPRVLVRRDDFRLRRYVEREGTTAIFVVDASGSAALHRLAEAKGAVELLLAESYARRDRVGLIAFRGTGAEVLLPPTRALARAKRALAALPGGGGTPLAAAIAAAAAAADATRRGGSHPVVVFLTDGRANVALSGAGGRRQAEADALAAARDLRASRTAAVFIDTSPRADAFARRVAAEMGARYVPLPAADARATAGAVRAAAAGEGARRG